MLKKNVKDVKNNFKKMILYSIVNNVDKPIYVNCVLIVYIKLEISNFINIK